MRILSCEKFLCTVYAYYMVIIIFLTWIDFLPEGEQNRNLNASSTLHVNVFKIIDSFPSLGEMVPTR